MESKVILYERCAIEKEKLFIVDEVKEYLSNLGKKTITDFQYIRHDKKISIKVDMAQSSINPNAVNNYNYASIQNGTEKIFYYFIDKKEQVSPNTIKLYLSLDSINTFKINVDFYITDKTLINRMHKDRFQKIQSTSATRVLTLTGAGITTRVGSFLPPIYSMIDLFWDEGYEGYAVSSYSITINNPNVSLASCVVDEDVLKLTFNSGSQQETFSYIIEVELVGATRYVRKIDKISEGVSPILYGKDILKLLESDKPENSYLVYKGSSAINCMLTFDNEHEVVIGAKEALDPTDFTTNKYYYFMCDTNGTPTADFYKIVGGDEYIVGEVYKTTYTRHCVVLTTDGTKLYLGWIVYTDRRGIGEWIPESYLTPQDIGTQLKVRCNDPSIRAFIGDSWTTNEDTIYGLTQTSLALTTSTETIRPLSSLDRSDNELIKIIKLPYSIVDLNKIDTTWGYNATDHFLQYIDLDKKLVNRITIPNSELDNPLASLNFDASGISATNLRSADNESKLFHSDYYQPKFVYDSFSKVFALERINLDSYLLFANTPFQFDFMASNTITSKFLFAFPQYITDGYMLEDFDNILPIDRNNEMTIYSSDYLNYIKTGFNYDIKKKNREALVGGLGTALSIVGSIASFASGNVFAIGAGIALASTAMTKLISTVNKTVQAEATQQQKLAQLRQQKDSVYNTDAVDLLDYYCDNKAKLMLYQVGENVKKSLFDLFFYTGYLCGYKGTPDFSSRIRFNFVSCDLDFDMDKTGSKYLSEEILQDISAKFSAGVTNIHRYNSGWDFDQKYENWETMFFS